MCVGGVMCSLLDVSVCVCVGVMCSLEVSVCVCGGVMCSLEVSVLVNPLENGLVTSMKELFEIILFGGYTSLILHCR